MGSITCTNVDYIIHDYMHGNYGIETAIDRCCNNKEIDKLLSWLSTNGGFQEGDRTKANNILISKGLL